MVQRNWLIGKRIAEAELAGKDRADYGVEVIKRLSKELTDQYGKGFAKTNLYSYYLFYKTYPDIFHTVCGKSELLSWSHYRLLIYVDDSEAREWYHNEAFQQTWSFRTLQRNINTQYYYRLLQSQDKDAVEREMKDKTSDYQNDMLEFIKNPIIAGLMVIGNYLPQEAI